MAQGSERRSDKRVAASKELQCFIAGQKADAQLRNLSTGGAMLEVSGVAAKRGDTVLLKIIGLTSLIGKVSWQDGEFLGFEFQSPLHPAVVDYLGFEDHGVEVPQADTRRSA